MEPPIHSIIAGIASLRDRDRLLQPALGLAAWLGADVQLVHVVDPDDPFFTTYRQHSTVDDDDPSRRFTEGLAARLGAQARALNPGARATCRAAVGSAAAELTRAALTSGADLVVVGPGHAHGVEGAPLGSTLRRVLQTAPVPVLVFHGPFPDRPLRVLLAADPCPTADAAHARGIAIARELGGARGSLVRVLCVEHEGPLRHEDGLPAAERVAGMVAAIAGAEPRVRAGLPAAEILAEAREWDADVVVMGTHGCAGAARFFLGSVAEATAREAPCAVLVVPPPLVALATGTEPVLRAV
jgi:nucleotide-binding universal stress UspA family protein